MAPPARLLDLTRSVSRLGQGVPTGIDRVERAWLAHLLVDDVPLCGLVRTRLGFLLLDRAGCATVQRLIRGEETPGPGDALGRLTRRSRPVLAAAEATLRRVAVARTWAPGLGRCLRRHLPRGAVYLDVGHAGLTPRVLSALRTAGMRAAVLVHDTIPLDHPALCRPGAAAACAARLRAASAADLVIHSCAATRAATEDRLRAAGRVPEGITAPLGVEPGDPALATVPRPARPYFIALGTIEARKDHALLLDVWQSLPPDRRPLLLIAGRRGWAPDALFARIEAAADVEERAGLTDADVAHLLAGARALLFPTRAEGFGLPALEAASFGTPVVCPPHAAFRELLGDDPVYLPPGDTYAWAATVLRLTAAPERRPARAAQGWAAHFKLVLTRV